MCQLQPTATECADDDEYGSLSRARSCTDLLCSIRPRQHSPPAPHSNSAHQSFKSRGLVLAHPQYSVLSHPPLVIMFAKLFTTASAISALAVLAVATPAPAVPEPTANSLPISILLGLLGIVLPDLSGLVGLGCTPISVIGVGSGNACCPM
ncbi:hypothetical protein C8Q74DRAFT_1310574 [Fomes fomentarius]|nr:hypothetical protein C8Q74DRAFT_1310574 [Fomes fomentarius]